MVQGAQQDCLYHSIFESFYICIIYNVQGLELYLAGGKERSVSTHSLVFTLSFSIANDNNDGCLVLSCMYITSTI